MQLHLLPLLLLPLLNSGCTYFMWQEAIRPYDAGGELVGTVGQGPERRLVVSYQSLLTTRYYILPMDQDRLIAQPVAYDGLERSAAGIARDLSETQRSALRELEFAPASRVETRDVFWFGWMPHCNGQTAVEIDDIDCRAYAVDDQGPLPVIHPNGANEPMLVDDARIVLVPTRQPRPPDDRRQSIGRAVIMTPVTVAGDILFSPLLLMWAISEAGGH